MELCRVEVVQGGEELDAELRGVQRGAIGDGQVDAGDGLAVEG